MIENISVDLNKLYTNKIKLEDYFILFCLVNDDQDALVNYTTHCGGIDTKTFFRLRDSGFIILEDEVTITFSSIKTTLTAKKLFNAVDNQQFDLLFKELLANYPTSVKRPTGGVRRLHNDLTRCKKLYKSYLVSNGTINIDLHRKIQLCVQLYHREHLKDNKQEFMQLLATFLHQKTWEQYLNEVSNIQELPKSNTDYDAI